MKTLCLATLIGVLSLAAGQTSSGVAPCAVPDPFASSVVEDTAGALRLAQAVNCSGGSFNVTWIGSVTVEETIHVPDGTTLNVTGSSDGSSVADGVSQTSLFTLDGGGTLHLSDLTLTNGRGEAGGAILAVQATVTLNSCTFLDNAADFNGGGLLLAASELIAKDVNFEGNFAQFTGGAMYADGSQITLDGSLSFVNNEADHAFGARGGALALFASDVTGAGRLEFVGNSAWLGGAAYMNASTLVLDGPLLLANNSVVQDGGGIWGAYSDLTVARSALWKGNKADGSGAGMIMFASTISMSDETEFIENTAAGSGGAIAMSSTSMVFDGPVCFSNNSVVVDGGAVHMEDGSILVFNGPLLFESNSAARDAGGVNGVQSTLTVAGSAVWQHNQAGEFGGGLKMVESTVMMSNDSQFTSNTAEYGGAVMIGDTPLVLDGPTVFWNNSATAEGGAIDIVLSVINITSKVVWKNNQAGILGGAMSAGNSTVRITGDTDFLYNNGYAGGAIGMRNATLLVDGFLNCTNNFVRGSGDEQGFGGAISSHDSVVRFSGVVYLVGNEASEGGGLFVGRSSVQVSGQLRCTGNTATTQGGAINVAASTLSVDGFALFSGNVASEGGGAAWVSFESVVTIAGDAVFQDNSAAFGGGGLFVFESTLEVTPEGSLTIDRNSAIEGGGLIAYSNSTVTVLGEATFTNNTGDVGGAVKVREFSTLRLIGTGVTMTGNYAVSYGGAMECESITVLQVEGVRFVSNSAGVGGGAVSMVSAGTAKTITVPGDPALFIDSWFAENKANETGGAMYVVGGFANITGTEFHNNTAGRSGGAILVSGAVELEDCTLTGNQAGVGPAVSNTVTVELASTELSSNTLTCDDDGLFLDWKNASAYETACEACPEECSTCTTQNPDRVQLCESVLEFTTSRTADGTLETIDLEPGYWRSSSTSKDIRECYHGPACVGGSEEYCDTGYEGPFCAVCADGYTTGVGYTCAKCTGSRRGATIAVISVVLVVAVALTAASCVKHRRSHSAQTSAGESSARRGLARVGSRLKRSRAAQTFKIIVVSWQIITQFASVASVAYPEIYETFLGYVDVVNLDLAWMMSAGCLIDTDFYDSLLVSTIGPLVMTGLVLLSRTVMRRRYPGNDQIKRSKSDRRHASAIFWVSFLVYSKTSATIFQTFACDEIDNGTSFLRVDHSVQCFTPRHKWFMGYAGVMSIIYPFGIPFCYAAVLYYARTAIKSGQEAVAGSTVVLKELWQPYQKDAYFYEVVECLRRVVLSGVVVFVLPNTAGQIATSFLLSMFFFVIFMVLNPYQHRSDTWLGIIGHAVVMLSMFSGLLEKVDIEGDDSFSQEVFAVVLIVAHLAMVLFLAAEACGVSLVVVQEFRRPSRALMARVGGRRQLGA